MRWALVASAVFAVVAPPSASSETLVLHTRPLSAGHERSSLPQVAVNKNGEGYAVWGQTEDYKVVGHGLFDSSPGGIETLSGPLPEASRFSVALNENGVALIVWRGNGRLEARYRFSDGRMSEIFEVAGGDGSPLRAFVDSLGNAVVAWRFDGGIYVRRFALDIPLGPPTRVTPGDEVIASTDAAVSPAGRVVVVWSRFEFTQVQIKGRELRADGVLGPVVELSPPAEGTEFGHAQPRVAIDTVGDAFITWTVIGSETDRAVGRHWDGSGLLGDTQELEGGSYSGSTKSPMEIDVAMNSGGDAFAVWEYMNDGNGVAIHGRLRRSDGSLGPIEEFAPDGHGSWPRVGLDDATGAVVAWAEVMSDISVRRRLPDGSQTNVATASRNGIVAPPFEVASSCGGHALLLWANPWDDGVSVHAGFFYPYVSTTRCDGDPVPPPADPPPPDPPPDESPSADPPPQDPPPADPSPAEPPPEASEPPADPVGPSTPAAGPAAESPERPFELAPTNVLRLQAVRASHSRVRLRAPGRLPRSLDLRFHLNAPALVTVRLERATTAAEGCLSKDCRWRPVASRAAAMTAGHARLRLSPLVGHRVLRPGDYRAVVTADAGEGQAAAGKVGFRMVAPRPAR